MKPFSPIFNPLKIKGEGGAIGGGRLTAERGGKSAGQDLTLARKKAMFSCKTVKGLLSFAAEKSLRDGELLEAAKVSKPGSELNLRGDADLSWVLFCLEGCGLRCGEEVGWLAGGAAGRSRQTERGRKAAEWRFRPVYCQTNGCRSGMAWSVGTRGVCPAGKAALGCERIRARGHHELSTRSGTGP